jgi:hypothetical protein
MGPMKKRSMAAALAALAAGCTENVGACFDDGTRGRDTVVVGSHVEYAGQAILNQACATGCHNSEAKGSKRNGAPAGLDFNLNPVSAETADRAEDSAGRTYAVLDDDVIAGLRARQREVFTERNLIWQQVRDGMMPPDGAFKRFWNLVAISVSGKESPCTRGDALGGIDSKASQDLLRNWLACQAPIVESYGGPVELDGVAGRSGYQYLACEVEAGAVGLVDLMDETRGVFTSTGCTGCHPASARDYPLDLSSIDRAYATLVEDTTVRCEGKPYVTPNEPDRSFLLDVLTKDDPGCGITRMPFGLEPLSAGEVQQVRDWIAAGAPRSVD